MKKYLLLCICFVLTACTTFKVGKYYSVAGLYGESLLIATFASDSTFRYSFAPQDWEQEEVKGTWKIKKDTLILYSPIFSEKRPELSPIIKYSDIDSLDKYLIRGEKIYIIRKEGIDKYRYLKIFPDSVVHPYPYFYYGK